MKVERLFVAVWPPEDVIDELRLLRRKDQRGVRFLEPDTWHVTLRFLGDADADEAIEALHEFDQPFVTACLGPGVDVFAGRSLVVPVAGLEPIAAEVARLTADIGEPPRRTFVGHLTIARLKPSVPMPPTLGAYISAAFEVEELALVSSRLHPEGARYTTIATFPLSR